MVRACRGMCDLKHSFHRPRRVFVRIIATYSARDNAATAGSMRGKHLYDDNESTKSTHGQLLIHYNGINT